MSKKSAFFSEIKPCRIVVQFSSRLQSTDDVETYTRWQVKQGDLSFNPGDSVTKAFVVREILSDFDVGIFQIDVLTHQMFLYYYQSSDQVIVIKQVTEILKACGLKVSYYYNLHFAN